MPDRRAIFVDRDGTLIEEVNYLTCIAQIRILEGSIEAVKAANQMGFLVVVITNQSAVARGMLTETELVGIHHYLGREFAQAGACLDAFYYCPHHPEGTIDRYRRTCACRKPSPGLLKRAAVEMGIKLSSSAMVGDRFLDVETGRQAGCRSILVRTGYGEGELADPPAGSTAPDFVAADLLEAVKWFGGQSQPRDEQ